MREYMKMASEMTPLIDDELRYRLDRVDELIRTVKPIGGLMSSQIIATIVEQWERDKDAKV